jgi:hypothetical protein
MIADLAPLLDLLPWGALAVLITAYVNLRFRHRLAKDALARVRGERDALRQGAWTHATGKPSNA